MKAIRIREPSSAGRKAVADAGSRVPDERHQQDGSAGAGGGMPVADDRQIIRRVHRATRGRYL
jgi:hypothetical protein